jgi:flagellar protein FliO/FliZ
MDLDIYLRFLIALVAVLALIAGLTWLVRRMGFGGVVAGRSGHAPRLQVMEVKVLDSRRKLVLIRRDDREHLILLGPQKDLLVEGAIAAPPSQPAAQPDQTRGEPSLR